MLCRVYLTLCLGVCAWCVLLAYALAVYLALCVWCYVLTCYIPGVCVSFCSWCEYEVCPQHVCRCVFLVCVPSLLGCHCMPDFVCPELHASVVFLALFGSTWHGSPLQCVWSMTVSVWSVFCGLVYVPGVV